MTNLLVSPLQFDEQSSDDMHSTEPGVSDDDNLDDFDSSDDDTGSSNNYSIL